ncbi:Xre family transcriptional regulator [Scopulibacillus darangshiensis]|uniref:Xre family transcriptional regulator n=1 Tax=Scopulibacillus darangshiensis TaxID=442528 RepID=A0A4R2N9V5_9BACL|nr:helix-turn-helix transcriptional regulator [Scopulibacillus darangshiensis]TCP17768.1 Xre family transcriptional regulator [Scopulibacillus darangshiensis]
MERKQWGRRIRAFRKLKGLTQEDLARKLGVSLSILGEIERENRTPTPELVQQVSETLNVSIDEILVN